MDTYLNVLGNDSVSRVQGNAVSHQSDTADVVGILVTCQFNRLLQKLWIITVQPSLVFQAHNKVSRADCTMCWFNLERVLFFLNSTTLMDFCMDLDFDSGCL